MQNCYVCNYCPNTLGTEIIIDFGGRPSCESCFDSGAYLKQGIPPSPHLSQAGFTFDSPALPPPRSKWGAQAASASNESPWTATKAASKDSAPAPGPQPRPPAWRIQQQRDSSPMARSFDELGEKLQRVGFETSHSRSPAALSVTTTTSQATRQPVDTSLVGSAARSEDLEKHQRLPLLTLDKDFCPVCRQSLGNEGSFIQLPATSSYGAEVVLHEECFTCGKCSLKLGQGKHVEAEGKHWHKDVRAMEPRYDRARYVADLRSGLSARLQSFGSGQSSHPCKSKFRTQSTLVNPHRPIPWRQHVLLVRGLSIRNSA